MSELPVINTMWVEGPLSYLEKVCLKSALACGHKVVLHTYFDVTGVPEGVEVRDGRKVMGEEYLVKHKKQNSWALCSDIFRYKAMKHNLGVWVDMDVYMLKPFDRMVSSCLFGWQDESHINNAVLYLERDSRLVDALLGFVDLPYIVPPWLPWRERMRHRIRQMLGLRPLTLAEHLWGTTGPYALTFFAKKLDLVDCTMPQDVFYPLHFSQANLLFDPDADVESYITDRTKAVHLWNERIKGLKRAPAPKGSFIEKICIAHDVSMA